MKTLLSNRTECFNGHRATWTFSKGNYSNRHSVVDVKHMWIDGDTRSKP